MDRAPRSALAIPPPWSAQTFIRRDMKPGGEHVSLHEQGSDNQQQVWHPAPERSTLWQRLSKRVVAVATAHRGCLPNALPDREPAPQCPSTCAPSGTADTPTRRHAKRLCEAVHTLTDSGRSINAAAREPGLDWRTVRKYGQATTWEECVWRTRPRRPTSLDPYLEYLRVRWEEGEHSAKVLHQELVTEGYCGHYQLVIMAVAPLRRGLPIDTPRASALTPGSRPLDHHHTVPVRP